MGNHKPQFSQEFQDAVKEDKFIAGGLNSFETLNILLDDYKRRTLKRTLSLPAPARYSYKNEFLIAMSQAYCMINEKNWPTNELRERRLNENGMDQLIGNVTVYKTLIEELDKFKRRERQECGVFFISDNSPSINYLEVASRLAFCSKIGKDRNYTLEGYDKGPTAFDFVSKHAIYFALHVTQSLMMERIAEKRRLFTLTYGHGLSKEKQSAMISARSLDDLCTVSNFLFHKYGQIPELKDRKEAFVRIYFGFTCYKTDKILYDTGVGLKNDGFDVIFKYGYKKLTEEHLQSIMPNEKSWNSTGQDIRNSVQTLSKVLNESEKWMIIMSAPKIIPFEIINGPNVKVPYILTYPVPTNSTDNIEVYKHHSAGFKLTEFVVHAEQCRQKERIKISRTTDTTSTLSTEKPSLSTEKPFAARRRSQQKLNRRSVDVLGSQGASSKGTENSPRNFFYQLTTAVTQASRLSIPIPSGPGSVQRPGYQSGDRQSEQGASSTWQQGNDRGSVQRQDYQSRYGQPEQSASSTWQQGNGRGSSRPRGESSRAQQPFWSTLPTIDQKYLPRQK